MLPALALRFEGRSWLVAHAGLDAVALERVMSVDEASGLRSYDLTEEPMRRLLVGSSSREQTYRGHSDYDLAVETRLSHDQVVQAHGHRNGSRAPGAGSGAGRAQRVHPGAQSGARRAPVGSAGARRRVRGRPHLHRGRRGGRDRRVGYDWSVVRTGLAAGVYGGPLRGTAVPGRGPAWRRVLQRHVPRLHQGGMGRDELQDPRALPGRGHVPDRGPGYDRFFDLGRPRDRQT